MLRSILSFLLSLFKSHTQLHLEVLFLRKQLEIVARSSPKLKIRPTERFLMGFLTDLYESWREALLIVQPDTVIRWHRQSFRLFWKRKSRSTPGRPAIPQTQINLIKQMATENPLWGAPVPDQSTMVDQRQQSTTGGKENELLSSEIPEGACNIW